MQACNCPISLAAFCLPSLQKGLYYLYMYSILYPLCCSINTDKPNTLRNAQNERRPSCPRRQIISIHIFECSIVN